MKHVSNHRHTNRTHERYRRKRSRSRRGKHSKFNLKHYIIRNRKKLLVVAVSIFVVIALVVVAGVIDKGNEKQVSLNTGNAITSTTQSIKLEIPLFTDDVSLANSGVFAVMNLDSNVPFAYVLTSMRGESATRMDYEIPVDLSFQVLGVPDGCELKSANIQVSENETFSDFTVCDLENKTTVKIYHLKTGTKYYYKLNLSFIGCGDTSAIGSFKTADTPRILSIEGAANVRDIGGWNTSYGVKVKQGLLYRGSELDGAVFSGYTATPRGISTLKSVLGIRSDFDLRSPDENKNLIDALGSDVQHTYYSAFMYSYVFTPNGKSYIRRLFSDLSNRDKYPIYMHCTHGLDRTGTAVYLLEAILGVGEDDLMRDYQLSALYHNGLWAYDQMLEFVEQLKEYPGDNINEKAENFLKSVGVTDIEIVNIRNIFLGI